MKTGENGISRTHNVRAMPKTILKVNGRQVGLNTFVQGLIWHLLNGVVDSLDRIERPVKRIEVVTEEDE